MFSRNKVVWSDGLFIKPQHFQQQSRYHDNYTSQYVKGMETFPYGFISLIINEELLTLGKIALVSGSGMMADGTSFSFPDTDMPPPALELQDGFKANEIVYLCIPLPVEGGLEVQSGESASKDVMSRYVGDDAALRDNSEHNGELAAIRIAKAQPRLKFGSDDLSAYTKIAVARIVEKNTDGSIRLDKNFYPTMFSIASALQLRSFVTELAEGLEGRAIQIASRIGQPDQNGVADVSDFLLLQGLNRMSPLLRHYARLPNLHPRLLYESLIQIYGELATFFDEQKVPKDIPQYDHDLPERCWPQIISKLRMFIAATLAANAISINLEKKLHGYYLAPVHDPSIIEECEFVLAVKATAPIEKVQREFAANSKVSTIEKIRELVGKQLPGIPIRLMPVAPRQLPYHAGYTYFALDRSENSWKDVRGSKGFAFHVTNHIPGLEMQFWAIRG